MMFGPATEMSAPESGRACTLAEPLQVEISACTVGAGWIPACDVLIEGATRTALVVTSGGRGLEVGRDLQTFARWPVRLHKWHTN